MDSAILAYLELLDCAHWVQRHLRTTNMQPRITPYTITQMGAQCILRYSYGSQYWREVWQIGNQEQTLLFYHQGIDDVGGPWFSISQWTGMIFERCYCDKLYMISDRLCDCAECGAGNEHTISQHN